MSIAVLAAALALGAAPAHAASSGVKLIGCESSLDPAGRAATFEGRMRTKKSARRLQMRFTLQTRTREEPRWRTLPAAGFGKWLTSDPGVGRYVYTKRVVSLAAPGWYRTTVRFRWLDADGDRVASSRSTSPTCRQSDLRPNLRPLGVEAQPGADAGARPLPRPGRQPRPLARRPVRRRRLRRRHDAHSGPRARAARPASARSSRSRARRARTVRC